MESMDHADQHYNSQDQETDGKCHRVSTFDVLHIENGVTDVGIDVHAHNQ